MKSLLVKAAVAVAAVGLMASCSGLSVASNSDSKPKSFLLTKDKARNVAKTGASTPSGWSSSNGTGLPATVDLAVKNAAAALPKDKHGRPTYTSDGNRHRFVRTTAYSCAENEPGAYGNLNACGTTLKYGQVRSAAADWSRYPVGTTFKIKGLPYTYVIDDYGSALVGTNTIDIYHPTLRGMNKWGTRDVEINIIHWGSWERTTNLLRGHTKYDHCARMYYAALRRINSGALASNTTERESEDTDKSL